jgi:hypothetical protein|tara:strand:+ start:271 stop:519 length:249 start_codon:yes stop_codon:yes gene_type:complete
MSEKWEPTKKLKKSDGTIAYVWEGKLHNWEGPALIPEGNERKAEYYLYGIQYSKAEHKEAIRQQTGLPWYKKPAPKGQNHRN